MTLTNFQLTEILDTSKRDELIEILKAEEPQFVQTSPRVWVASFDADSAPYHAAVRWGRRHDVAEDFQGYQVALRVPEKHFDEDSFIPEATVADIVKLVGDEFEKRMVVNDGAPNSSF